MVRFFENFQKAENKTIFIRSLEDLLRPLVE